MSDPTATAAGPVYVTRSTPTRMAGYDRVLFRCSGCNLQGDMTLTVDERAEILAALGAAHATRHGGSDA